MPFKLIALDLDGTSIRSDLRVSERLTNILQKIKTQNGIRITIATGRMFATSVPYVEPLCANSPIISLNGAEIVDHKNGDIISSFTIPADLSKYGRELFWRYKGAALAVCSGRVFLNKLTPEASGSIKDWFAHPVIEPPPEEGEYSSFFAIGMEEELLTIVEDLHRNFYELIDVDIFPSLRYKPLSYLEVRAKGVSKGSGLKYLRELLGIDKSEVLAIGDWTNDIALFREAGFCATVANAAPQLKELAHKVSSLTNDEDGVAEILEELFF